MGLGLATPLLTVWISERFYYSTSDASVLLASTIHTAIYQQAEARLVALDIKEAFDSVWWKGLFAHLWSNGFSDKVFRLFESYISN